MSFFQHNSKQQHASYYKIYYLFISFSYGSTVLGGLGLVIVQRYTITLIDTPCWVGLLWTRDQLVAETST
jgi:hypothetical protein